MMSWQCVQMYIYLIHPSTCTPPPCGCARAAHPPQHNRPTKPSTYPHQHTTKTKPGTDEFCGFENVEPEDKPHARRRTLVRKWVGVLLQMAALFAVPILAGVCYRDPDRCRAIGILDFYKF